MTESEHRLLEYRVDPRDARDVISGRTGGSSPVRRRGGAVLPMVLAACTAAIVATGVIAIISWPALPSPIGVVPVLVAATATGVLAGRVMQRRSR
ncbi:MAG: hypothetical protein ACLGH3_05970 [Actinomycetota bacterium]